MIKKIDYQKKVSDLIREAVVRSEFTLQMQFLVLLGMNTELMKSILFGSRSPNCSN
jgi:hypothetical protein